jgi:hypothetical protein
MQTPSHPYDPAALAALGRDRVATDAAHCPVVSSRAAVVVRYGCDSQGRGQWVATLKRSPRERAARLAVPAAAGPDAAAAALLSKQGLPWRALPAVGSLDGGESYAYVTALTPSEGEALAHGADAIIALAACRELVAACAAGADAEALALPLMLARSATGQQRGGHPAVVAGFALLRGQVEIRGVMGEALFTLPDTLSAAHALAACHAAGWLLTAPMADLATRWADLGQTLDPAAVALALEARGGCPAVVAALTAKGVA